MEAPSVIKIDLHGYHPTDIVGPALTAIIQQAWETGQERLRFIHGHGRARGISRGFFNTNTGYFGRRIRRELRSNVALRQWIKYTTLDCSDWGATTVRLKKNPSPSRVVIDESVFPERSYSR